MGDTVKLVVFITYIYLYTFLDSLHLPKVRGHRISFQQNVKEYICSFPISNDIERVSKI